MEHPGKQPLRETVGHDDCAARGERRLDGREGDAAAEEGGPGHEHRQVQEQPLEVPVGVLLDRRPRDRRPAPRNEQGHGADCEPPAPRARQRPRRDQRGQQHESTGHDAGGHPGTLEIAAGEESERRRTGEERPGC